MTKNQTVSPADIPVVLLAGGRGTRLMEETRTIPKPMVTVGESPILVHIMRYYASFGFRKFVICLGYKGHIIKDYFLNYTNHTFDMVLSMKNGESHRDIRSDGRHDDWEIVLAETGEHSLTGRRLHLAQRYLDAPTFALSYGDGVADVALDRALDFHFSHDALATVTAVHPPSRFGRLSLDDDKVTSFREKETLKTDYINGGFFFFQREFLQQLDGSNVALESAPLTKVADDGQMRAFRHDGFWQCMDTLRDRQYLEELYEGGDAPWQTW